MKPKNIFFNIAVHVGIIALILHIHIMTSCLPYNDPIMMIFFCMFSALGFVIHPTLFNNKTVEKFLWYLLCYTSFVIPNIHLGFYYHGLLGFIAVICTMLLMNLLVNCNASAKYFPNTEHINLMVSRNIKFICYIGGLSEISFLLYSQFAHINEEIASFYGIIELSIIVLWCIYNIVYLYPKHVILVVPIIISLINNQLFDSYNKYITDFMVNKGLFIAFQYIIATFLILFAINQYYKFIKLSKDKWLLVTIIVSLIMLCGIDVYLYVEGFFPIKFAALQIASYAVAAFFLIRDYSNQSTMKLNIDALITGGLYAVSFLFHIVSIEVETGPGTEVIRHIQWSSMFVLFAFIVVVLSKLWFKKYNCIKSALFVFLGGVALNVAIVYNQDLANYATWLPDVLKSHLKMSVCYGAALWGIPKLMRLRMRKHTTPTTINEETLCEQEEKNIK